MRYKIMAKKNTHPTVKINQSSGNKTVTIRTNSTSSKSVVRKSGITEISESDKLTLRAWKHTYAMHGQGKS
jgi:hypothetical protein